MTKSQMIVYLERRYTSECALYPLLARNVTLAQFLSANLPHMLRSWYWKQYDLTPVSFDREVSDNET